MQQMPLHFTAIHLIIGKARRRAGEALIFGQFEPI
jgi:hypothetical protein